jgi:O-antigen biosynthesis protein
MTTAAPTSVPTTLVSEFEPIQVVRVDLASPLAGLTRTAARSGAPYRRARVLVLLHDAPVGVVWVDLIGESLAPARLAEQILGDLRDELEAHLARDGYGLGSEGLTVDDVLAGVQWTCSCTSLPAAHAPLASVVLATRGRPDSLPHAIDALLHSDHPNFEVVVVDNSPEDPRTADLVAQRYAGDARVRLVAEPRPGLSRARNRGMSAAQGDLLVFTDDDVMVHPAWLHRMTAEFADASVTCVTGLVEPAQLETRSQWWFECAAGFGRGTERIAYRLAQAPVDSPLFPYRLGIYGTGASMALRRSGMPAGWHFDEALGAGSATQGGEDIDLFLDVLITGGTLVYQPTALSFHTHRADDAGLAKQMRGYGTGLTALLVKRLMYRPAERRLLLSRVAIGVRHGLSPQFRKGGNDDAPAPVYPPAMRLAEIRGMVIGPFAYWSGVRSR